MSIDIQKIRAAAEGGLLKVKESEGITHALFRAGLENQEVLFNRLQLEAEFAKLNRKNREAIIALAKEIEKTIKPPLTTGTVIKLEQQVPSSTKPKELRYPPYIPEAPKKPDSITQNTFDKKETERVNQLFDVLKLGKGNKDWYIDDANKTILVSQKGGESYYLWDEIRGDSRTVYYLDKNGNPAGSVVIDKSNKVGIPKLLISTTGLTFNPTKLTKE